MGYVQRVFSEASFDLNLKVLKRVKLIIFYLLFISALFRVMKNVLFKFGEVEFVCVDAYVD
jgi:hypothetical protein